VLDGCDKTTLEGNVFPRVINTNFVNVIDGGNISILENVVYSNPNNTSIYANTMSAASRFLRVFDNVFSGTAILTVHGYVRSIDNNVNMQYAGAILSSTKPIIAEGSFKAGDTFTPNIALIGAHAMIAEMTINNITDYIMLIPFGNTAFRSFANRTVRGVTADVGVAFSINGTNATGTVNVFNVTGYENSTVNKLYLL
jgi:hypothetical protein